MIWEVEHLIFLFYKLVVVSFKLKLPMEILLVEVKILMESFQNIYLTNLKSNQGLMSPRIDQLFKDFDKQLKKLKLSFRAFPKPPLAFLLLPWTLRQTHLYT